MTRGSITVFMGMTIMLIMSLFFTLAEAIHYQVISMQKTVLAVRTTENIMARYNQILWEDYGILGVDVGFGQDRDSLSYLEDKLKADVTLQQDTDGVDLLRLQGGSIEIPSYIFLTDQSAAPFIQEAIAQTKYAVGEDIIQKWKEDADIFSQNEESAEDVEETIDEGRDALSEDVGMAEEMACSTMERENTHTSSGGYTQLQYRSVAKESEDALEDITESEDASEAEKYADAENPFEMLDSVRENGILGVALPEDFSVSEASMSGEAQDRVSGRTLSEGVTDLQLDTSGLEKLIFEQYLILHFQSATNALEREGMRYEMEYILCGESSDRDNLEDTIQQILLLREIENIIAITSDSKKMAEVKGYAVALTTASVDPLLYEAIKWGIVAVWAFIESILDVRTLLSGEKVPILKSQAQWTSELLNFTSYVGAGKKAKSSETGLSYEDYLRILMLKVGIDTLAYRCMDLCEQVICMQENYGNFRMDHVMVQGDFHYTFSATPIFFTVIPSLQGKYQGYTLEEVTEFSYL